jgi:hypothetical protein
MSNEKFLESHGFPKYEDLNVSTVVGVIYTNMDIDYAKAFKELPCAKVEYSCTKKNQRVDPRKIVAKKGDIVSVQTKFCIRGVPLRKPKKVQCTHCIPLSNIKKDSSEEDVKRTAIEIYEYSEQDQMYWVYYYCELCNEKYLPKEMSMIPHFLNQVSIHMSLGRPPLVNAMVFGSKLKISGCTSIEEEMEVVITLFRDYFEKIPNLYKLYAGEDYPRFTFDRVMKNMCFSLGFPVDRDKLIKYMNSEPFNDVVKLAMRDIKTQAGVNIKCNSTKPPGHKYHQLVFRKDKEYIVMVGQRPHRIKKRKDTQEKYVTFIVFCSSQVIMSGRYDEDMKRLYPFVVRKLVEDRDKVEESIRAISKSEFESIFSFT